MSSQLTLNPLGTSAIPASPSGLVRTSNMVTCFLSTTGLAAAVVGNYCTVDGSTSVLGNTFEGTYLISAADSGGAYVQWAQVAPDDTGGGGNAYLLPAFTDIADADLAGDEPFTQALAQALNHNGKFAVARAERFDLGYYTSGNVVLPPVSPVYLWKYSISECTFEIELYSSRQPGSGFTPGQLTPPNLADDDIGSGALTCAPYSLIVDQTTGFVTCQMYFADSGATSQGTIRVKCTAQKLSVYP